MPRSIRIVCLVAPIIAFAACDSPVRPSEDDIQPLMSATVAPKDEFVRFLDNTLFVPCANEDVRIFGEAIFWRHLTDTPSGNTIIHTTITGAPWQPLFLAVGQSSGKVWVFERNTVTFENVFRSGTRQVFHASDPETFVSEDGDVLRMQSTFHITVTPDKVVTVEHGGWTCR